jgi:hypothetical protein
VDVAVLQGAHMTVYRQLSEPPTEHLSERLSDNRLSIQSPPADVLPASSNSLDWVQYSLVVVRYLSTIRRLRPPSGIPTVVDADDAVRRYGPLLPGLPWHLRDRFRSSARTILSRHLLRGVTHALFCSDLDRVAFPGIPSSIVPNIPLFYPDPLDMPQPDGHRLLFVGSLWYSPNAEGVTWFIRQVWPLVRRDHPAATLRLVGPAPAAVRARWAQTPGIEAPGFQPDLTTEYQQAQFAIAPIWSGGGTSIKVLESCAFGKPTVITRFAHRPLEPALIDGQSTLVAYDAISMAHQCSTLLTSPNRRAQVGAAAQAVVRSSFSRAQFDAGLNHALSCVGGS